jgi:hypothetical protein
MLEFLITVLIFLGVSNFYFFLFFRQKNKKRRSKIFFAVIFCIQIVMSIILIVKKNNFFVYDILENIFFLFLINILISGYFLMLWGINSLLENILIIRGYFSYNVVFSILMISSTIIYYFISVMMLTFNYFQYF